MLAHDGKPVTHEELFYGLMRVLGQPARETARRVSAPFTGCCYLGPGERPSTELAHNSFRVSGRESHQSLIQSRCNSKDMVETRNGQGPESWIILPFAAGKLALELGLQLTVSLSRIAQIGAKSADAAIGKYIELGEQELGRSGKRESVKVD